MPSVSHNFTAIHKDHYCCTTVVDSVSSVLPQAKLGVNVNNVRVKIALPAAPDVLAIELAVSGRVHGTERVSEALDAGDTTVDDELGLPWQGPGGAYSHGVHTLAVRPLTTRPPSSLDCSSNSIDHWPLTTRGHPLFRQITKIFSSCWFPH